ncbi:MAG: PASTA domain-containing protein [Acidobacteria bacterium]|nr:PASTA domain-containing protein [Acidobacteriota bacterium]
MALKTRVWSAGKLLILGAALLATYILFAGASMRLALKAREVQAPDLTNRTVAEATALSGRLGLTLKIDETHRIDPAIAAGRIVEQDPPAGATTRRQRSLKVWLSAGPRVTTVPALAGEPARSAQMRLAEDGIDLVDLAEIRTADAPAGVVLAQSPPANATATHVSLLVNRGEEGATYVMPDLIGVSGDRVAEMLRSRGFRVAVVASAPYPGVAPGIVIRQSPQGGFKIAPGEPVSLEVSR